MTIQDILNKWIELTEYDPDQKQFNLLSSNFAFHQCGEVMTQLTNEYDPTGELALMYAKVRYKEILQDCKVSLFDVCAEPQSVQPYREMWDLFCNSDAAVATETRWKYAAQQILRAIGGTKLLADSDTTLADILYDSLANVAESLPKCNFEKYTDSTDIDTHKLDVHARMIVVDTLAEAITGLLNAADGIYIVYIRQFNSSSGYFGVFFHQGDTLVSFNDRVDEAFISQHAHSRNGRWQDSKKFQLFPYSEIVEDKQNQDYKGYSSVHIVNKEGKHLNELSANRCITLVIGILIFLRRLETGRIEFPKVFTNALLPNSEILNAAENQLIKLDNGVAVKREYDELSHHITMDINSESVLSTELQTRFNRYAEDTQNRSDKYKGWFTGAGQLFVDIWGDGFELDPHSCVRYSYPQLTDGVAAEVTAEYVGPEAKFELEVYRESRKQLHDHIVKRMETAYTEFGEIEGVRKWFANAVAANSYAVLRFLRDKYQGVIRGAESNYEHSVFAIPISVNGETSVINSETNPSANLVLNKIDKHEHAVCPITGNRVNVWVVYYPCVYTNIITMLGGAELPKVIQGWMNSNSYEYTGNSLIDVTDPIADIQTPMSHTGGTFSIQRRPAYDFTVALGFSKRGWNALMKDETLLDSIQLDPQIDNYGRFSML